MLDQLTAIEKGPWGDGLLKLLNSPSVFFPVLQIVAVLPVFDLSLIVAAHAGFEIAYAFAEAPCHFRDAPRAKQDDYDQRNYKYLGPS
jgi:hypothetical protein